MLPVPRRNALLRCPLSYSGSDQEQTNHVEEIWWAKLKFKSMFGPANRGNSRLLGKVYVEPEIKRPFLLPLLDSSYPTVPLFFF